MVEFRGSFSNSGGDALTRAAESESSSIKTWAMLLAGILAGQLWLYGPSLIGRRLLAPTDLLTAPGELNVVGVSRTGPSQHVMMDPVQVFYPWLRFAAREVRAGRLPTWNPYAYCGSPFLANMQSAVYSPFTTLFYLWPDPRVLPWIQLLKALVAGIGAFGFLRAIGLSKWPAIVGGWCFPLSGFLNVWLNFPLSAAAVWLPAGMWAVAALLKKPRGWGGPSLAVLVGLMLVSGHLETSAHVLLGMGIFGAWTWLANSRGRIWRPEPALVAKATALALLLGLALGAAQVLPTLEYVRSSHRLQLRREFQTERDYATQTLRWEAVRLAFPLLAGTEQAGSRALTGTGIHESGANGFVGVTLLLLMPIGIAAGWRRSETWLWLFVTVWFAAPMFQIPVLRWWDHLPPFHLAANSRALLLTGWGVLVLGSLGLNSLSERSSASRAGVFVSIGLAALLLVGLLAALLDPMVLRNAVPPSTWPWFQRYLWQSAAVTALALAGLLIWLIVPRVRRGARAGLGLLAFGELLATATGFNPQVDPSTFYPENALCRFLSDRVGEGRICGLWGALPPNLAMAYGLRDVRGYDAVDPDPYVELLLAMRGHFGPPHAITWQLATGPSPLFDMLGVRYFITPMPVAEFGEPVAQWNGKFVYQNNRALPRAFIPRRAVLVPQSAERLRRLGDTSFDPRSEVLITSASRLPTTLMSGSASIVTESADRVVLKADCATEAVIVLADAWSAGWTVKVDGVSAEVLQANHAVRAVVVPRGAHRIVWSYRPKMVWWGLACSLFAMGGIAIQAIGVARRRTDAIGGP